MDVNKEEIQTMKELVDLCVGIPLFTYEMQKNAPRPSGEYAAIKCTSSVNPGCDESKIVVVDGVEMFQTKGVRILTFQIVFSREGDEYIKYDNSYFRPDVIAFMKQRGLCALAKQALNLASLTLETNWEFRQGIVAQFNILRIDQTPIGIMDDASVAGKFIEGDIVTEIKGI